MKSIIEQVKNFDIVEQAQSAKEILSSFLLSYKQQNSWKIRLIDSYIVFCGLLLIIQFLFAFLNGMFPMNSLISGMVVCIGSMTLSGNIIIVIFNPIYNSFFKITNKSKNKNRRLFKRKSIC